MSHSKSERLKQILTMWNTGDVSIREIGLAFDMPRGSVARTLFEARKRGLKVLTFTHVEAARRARLFKP